MRGQKGPRSFAEAYRELSAIEEHAQVIFAGFEARIEKALTEAGCCLTIAEILREFRARAWRRAVREHDRGGLVRRRSRQLELF